MTGIVVDLFAGGGGASTGIEAALGRRVDLAINHDPTALAVHRANHPGTRHLDADIWEVRPRAAVGGRPVDLLWASPDCTHFSVAKGGKPRLQSIRSLAWVVVRWAKDVRPRVICVENVSEFKGWGPLTRKGQPDKTRMGETFRRWCGRLEQLGYVVEFRILDASLYGAPTKRRRLFIVARRDGLPIHWPEPTHGAGRLPLRTAAECIDWGLECPSIFERKRPLKPKTLWRIARGLERFVLNNPAPYIVRYHGERREGEGPRVESVDDPLPTQTTANRFGLVVPSIMKFRGDSHSSDPEEPMPTITAGNGTRPAGAGHALGLCVPTIVGVGGRSGQSPATSPAAPLGTTTAKGDRALVIPAIVEMNHMNAPRPVDEPLGVVTTQHNRHQLVLSLLQVGHGGDDARGESIEEPLTTVCASRRSHGLVAAHLSRDFGQSAGADLEEPTPTVMPGGGGKTALVSAFVAKHFGDAGQRPGLHPDEPLATVTGTDHHSAVTASLVKLRGECNGADVNSPMPTLTAAGNHVAEVRAFLTAFYGQDGTGGQRVDEPARTLTEKARLGLVTIKGREFQIVDIGMRMLQPEELLRAQFGDFAPAYARALVAANMAVESQEWVEDVA